MVIFSRRVATETSFSVSEVTDVMRGWSVVSLVDSLVDILSKEATRVSNRASMLPNLLFITAKRDSKRAHRDLRLYRFTECRVLGGGSSSESVTCVVVLAAKAVQQAD